MIQQAYDVQKHKVAFDQGAHLIDRLKVAQSERKMMEKSPTSNLSQTQNDTQQNKPEGGDHIHDLFERMNQIKQMGLQKSQKQLNEAKENLDKNKIMTPRSNMNMSSQKIALNLKQRQLQSQSLQKKKASYIQKQKEFLRSTLKRKNEEINYDDMAFDDLGSGLASPTMKSTYWQTFKRKINCCNRKKDYLDNSDSEDYVEPTNENDYTDYVKLSSLTPQEKEERLRGLWLKAFQKAKGAAHILNQFESLRTKIQLFGRNLLVNGSKKEEKEEIIQKTCPYILMPNSKFKIVWNLIIILMLLYTATYMPYQICFIDESSTGFMLAFEYLIDVLFFTDIFVNFISAFERPDGVTDPRLKSIARYYIKGWFFLDLFATFPTQVLESSDTTSGGASSAHYNKLLRLARLPRLYRLLRILRLFKIVKIMRYNQGVQRFMDKIKMNAAVGRMIFILVFAFFSVHLISCFWFLAAKFDDYNPDTWVARLSLQDETSSTLYLECLYWALQTVATVGFGDFGAFTIAELFLSVVWMIYGVGFYSVVIGNLTSIIANETANSENLYNKLKALEEFAKKTNLPEELHFKIRQFLENNYNELFSRIDEKQLLQELPVTLRDEVLQHQYEGLLNSLDFLKECENNDFVWALVQMLRKIKVDKDDVIYWEGDFSEEIYFIKSGKVKLYAKNGFPFLSYKDGMHFGDPEVIFKEPRDGKAIAQTDCLFYSLSKDDLDKLLEQYPDMKKNIFEEATRKKENHKLKKQQAEKITPLYGRGKHQQPVQATGENIFLKQKLKFGLSKVVTNENSDEKDESKLSKAKSSGNLMQYQEEIESPQNNNRPQTDAKNGQLQITITKPQDDDDKSTIPSSLAQDQLAIQDQAKNDKKHLELQAKMKERFAKVLVNVDSAPDFTKNVSSLLQANPDSNQASNMIREPNNRYVENFDSKFMKQRKVEELKKAFAQRNKVSTMESYEKKRNDSLPYSQGQLQMPSIQEIIEQDETLGDADAEQGLENLARFNEDMSMIALNVYQIYNLFDLISKENEEIISWMHSLERQTINVEERHFNLEKKIDQLLNNYN